MDIQNKGFLSIEQLRDRYPQAGRGIEQVQTAEGFSFEEVLETKKCGKP